MRERRQRDGSFVDVGDLRRALAVCAVDRPVAIRLPDGRKFAVADARLDRDSGAPVEEAAVLLIAGRDCATPGPRVRASSVSAPVGRNGFAQPQDKEEPR